ncbi:hypothetical protein [Vibrio alginolyticus]|uniref:hypothetical protein n=1 Tax=Vibrio alginolyticus TaxID=663 RepID=UPI0006CA8990|nr:hypothetical protein [Vibrio alginolyticus]KPM97637.1 hypothetical protein AOG25_14340 [Vibrio alginolyticus]CAH7374384.1 conserved hypothetical protein [Vibrio chagasii]
MKETPLNFILLQLIQAVKLRKELAQTEQGLGLTSNWKDDTRQYFFNLDSKWIESLGLEQNDECLFGIIRFDISDEIKSTKHVQLHKFSLTY